MVSNIIQARLSVLKQSIQRCHPTGKALNLLIFLIRPRLSSQSSEIYGKINYCWEKIASTGKLQRKNLDQVVSERERVSRENLPHNRF